MECPFCNEPRIEVGFYKNVSIVYCETCNYSAVIDRLNPRKDVCVIVPAWPPPTTPLYPLRKEENPNA